MISTTWVTIDMARHMCLPADCCSITVHGRRCNQAEISHKVGEAFMWCKSNVVREVPYIRKKVSIEAIIW